MADRHRSTPSKRTGSARRWPGFGEPAGDPRKADDADSGLHPAVDPRTVPVPSGLEIHVLEGDDAGKTFALDTCEVVLGRRLTPEEKKVGWLLFNDSTVSRMHAVLEWRGGPRRYRLTHRSRTNPTLINGRIIHQAVLYPDDMVRIGDVTFQVRVTRRGVGEEPPAQVEDKGQIYSGFKVSVVEGPDKGRQFVLEHKVVHVGGPDRAASATPDTDTRGHNWMVLTDNGLPREQAFFVWYDADKKYGIFHAGASPVPTQISRVLTTPRGSEAKNEARNLLSVDDMVILGDTTLMMLKHERFHETVKALRADGAGASPARPQRSHGQHEPHRHAHAHPPPAGSPLKKTGGTEDKRKVLEITPRDNQTPLREADETPAIRVRGDGLPAHLLPDIGGGPAMLDRPFDATHNWFSRPDYGLEVVDGPERGRRIALMSGAMRAGRELLLGRPGRRVNDIEIKDEAMENEQARIHYDQGRFTLVNEGAAEIMVNEQPLAQGKPYMLKNGDELEFGKSVLLFIDHGAMQRQFQFEMEILSENGKLDRSRRITLNQDAMSIGRSKKADIRVDDPNVSRVHAQVAFRRGGFILEHKSETNPTFINGVGLDVGQERLLQPDDEIQVADGTTLVFRRRMALQLKA